MLEKQLIPRVAMAKVIVSCLRTLLLRNITWPAVAIPHLFPTQPRLLIRIAAISAITGWLCGCGPDRELSPPSVPVVRTQVVEVVPRPRSASLIGEYRARFQSDLSFLVGGRIERRLVDVGDHVDEGDLLATLDHTQQVAAVTAAKAAVRSSNAELDEARARKTRVDRLMQANASTQSEVDDAEAALVTALGSVDISNALLANAETQLSYTSLRSPTSGVIVSRMAESGQVVAAGQAVFTIAADGEREAVFEAFLKDSSDQPVSDEITLSLVSDPEIVTQGRIREISPAIDASTGTVRVKVSVPDPPAQMALGAPVLGVARFHPVDVATLPWTALARTGDRPAVWLFDPSSSTVAERVVDVEKHTSGLLFVTHGINAGDIVVTAGSQMICPGQQVKPLSPLPKSETKP